MISYRKADLADRIMEHSRPTAIEVIKSLFKWTTKFINPNGPSDDMDYDYTQCRCENNGDYCEYCEDIYQTQSNRPKTISKSALWNILENADRNTGLWRYLKKNMPPREFAELEHAMDSPVLAKMLHGMIFFEPDTENIREGSISYRQADLVDRVNEKIAPRTIDFHFNTWHGVNNVTHFEGGVFEDQDKDWPDTVVAMFHTIEKYIHSRGGYEQQPYGESVIKGASPVEVAVECRNIAKKQPQCTEALLRDETPTNKVILEVTVKGTL